MFKSLTSFLAQAAEVTTNVLVGHQSKDVEFQGHWRTITTLVSESDEIGSESCMSEINAHLERMADLLFQEEEGGAVSMGPCMELMIRHKILDTLCATGKSDYPAGMRKAVFKFFCLLLGRIQQPLLPHIAVHRPLNNLVRTCGLSLVNPLAVDEIQFIRTLCLTLHADPTLSNFFIEDKNDKQDVSFTVSEALMRITNSEENLVCLKAFECLLLCVSLKTVSDILANSQFPLLLASKMRQHLQLLSPCLSYIDILNSKAGWGVNYASSTAVQCLSPSPHQPLLHLEAYLSWLDYCEQVINGSPEVLQESVCKCIRELILETILLPKISLTSEVDLVIGLALLAKTISSITHRRLVQEFVQFILTRITKQLVLSCNHLNEDVCCISLILLRTLFNLPFPLIPSLLPFPQKQQQIDKKQLEDTVKSYLSIVPTQLLSAHEVGGDSGLVYYLVEAQQQVSECQQHIREWNSFPSNSLPKDQSPSLITGLLDRLERLLDQSYDLNLHLTSVLSLLASYPQMDRLFIVQPDTSDHQNLYTVLNKVSLQLQSHAERTPGLQLNIVEARRRLVGQETSDLLSMPNNELLEGAILLEEFCKELGAILYCRYSLDFLTLTSSDETTTTGDHNGMHCK